MIKMKKINNYNKEEHIQFIETLIKTEQVAVFINNMDISEKSKIEQNDTLEYLYNRIIELQNNWNELNKFVEEEKNRLATEVSNTYEDSLGKTRIVNEDIYNEVKKISDKMQELENKNV